MHSRHNYHKLVTEIIVSNRNVAAAYTTEQEKKKNFDPNKHYNDKMRFKGREWFFKGNDLEDAPDEQKNNPLFIEGYEAARKIADDAYAEGFKWFLSGKNMASIPKHYQENIYFMQGYKDAINQSLLDGIDWSNIPNEFVTDDSFNFNDGKLDSSVKRHK